ncbi:MAG: protein translocase subunit SecD [Lachnospiraceae bacterium]|nr:protein translocase subunit SecD [Lachnospiraceae bacterium]
MKKQIRNSIIGMLIFILLVAGGVYTVINGLGKEKTGSMSGIKLGLDLAGGVSITYEVVGDDPSEEDMKDTVYRLTKRVEAISSEGEVYQEGNRRITIEIPDVDDPEAVLTELGKPGALEFLDQDNYDKWAKGDDDYTVLLDGNDVASAQGGIDDKNGSKEYVCQLAFTSEGTTKFADATTNNVGKLIYIIYEDGDETRDSKDVASAATVNEPITGGNAVINGLDSYEEADALATTIRIGALPLTLKQLRSNIVGAKLGESAIKTSLIAGAIGIGIIMLLMIILFRIPGLVASLALGAYIVLTLISLNIAGSFGITLTLPGIAGIILTIGMAVDANVIIFTRIKEELRAGSSVKRAIDAGFDKALSAILDGNITTLIAAAVLWIMGIGTIKGFAATLAIGVLLSMFSALFITKRLLNAFFVLGCNKVGMYGVAKEPKVLGYVNASKYCAVGSVIVIVVGLAFLFVNKANIGMTLNYSTEFLGGTSIQAEFDKEYSLSEAEESVSPVVAESTGVDVGKIQLQTVNGTNEVIIKVPELTAEQQTAVKNALTEKLNASEFTIENISSTVSGEMRRDAILSVVVATILMLIYIAFRFDDVRFGAAAVIALLHDVLVVFTVYSVFRLSVGNTFIACMLTIVGYSINATIIIFDRIRENKTVMNVKRDGLDTLVNTSIAQTFTRSIYTTLTTLSTIVVLYIMGVASLKEFTLTLIAGLICGAYSSVCLTGPIWWFLTTKTVKKPVEKSKSGKSNKKKA